jgi:hypothetical protein
MPELSCEELRRILVSRAKGIGPEAADAIDEPLGPGVPPRLELLHLVLISASATADERALRTAALIRDKLEENKQDAHKAAGQAARRYLTTERSAEALRAAESAALAAFLADPANVREFDFPVHPALAGLPNPPNVKHDVSRHIYRTLRAFLPNIHNRLGMIRAVESLLRPLTGRTAPSRAAIEKALRGER